jgi:hypothetical protein
MKPLALVFVLSITDEPGGYVVRDQTFLARVTGILSRTAGGERYQGGIAGDTNRGDEVSVEYRTTIVLGTIVNCPILSAEFVAHKRSSRAAESQE